METINDIPHDQLDAQHNAPDSAPMHIESQFGSPSVLKFVALGVSLFGAALTVAGIVLFIIPLGIVGVVILLAGGAIYFGRGIRRLAEINPTPESSGR